MPNNHENNHNSASISAAMTETGFHDSIKDSRGSQTHSADKVILRSSLVETPAAKRLLDLTNINTASLKVLSPTEKELETLKLDRTRAITDYAERLRQDYKTDRDGFRDGLRILSDSLEKGEQITIACSCRGSGSLCHADVVKMAVEKVNAQIKNALISKVNEAPRAESLSAVQENSQTNQTRQGQILNPRTQKAVNEILSFSANDRILEKINQTDGRNRSEQASYLGKSSQFVRDLYEHGANIVDGNLIVPQEKLNDSSVPVITTEAHAVDRINKILQDEARAKELAPMVVEYGNKIAGVTTDGETKLKVFGWIYDSLEGKSDIGVREAGEKPDFNETLEKIRGLAEEMNSLEPLDKIEFVPLAEFEKSYAAESLPEKNGEILNPEAIYEEAINPEFNEQSFDNERGEKINKEGFKRIDLNRDEPRIPADYSQPEILQLINETLPEVDRQLENGISPKEILTPFNEAIWQSARDDAQKRLAFIYQKQKPDKQASQVNRKNLEANQSLEQQLAKVSLLRQNIIEIKHPVEYLQAEKEAINAFYRQQKQQIGNLLTKIDEVRENHPGENSEEIVLRKELNKTRDAKPNFGFKLENSAEIVVGRPSEESVQKRNFISVYINYQLEKPETSLRYENERYRNYAMRLENAATRDEVMKTSSEIRTENAGLGICWKELAESEKEKISRPLTRREIQFLFTEVSPAHYTGEMTAARLSYAHSGATRRQMTESLSQGVIRPSPEAQKLVENLESRLQRRDLKDSLLATRHFFESLKNPNESLKYKNKFDHRKIYQKLPPQEKDFIYQRASQQKENLQYQLAFKKELSKDKEEFNLSVQPRPEMSRTEETFHLNSLFYQARVLSDRIDSEPLAQNEITARDISAIAVLLNNQSAEKLEILAGELQQSENLEKRKMGEVLGNFTRAEISKVENKSIVRITLPENNLVSTDAYHELLERFYPDNKQESDKYKFENINNKELSRAREKGQDEALKEFHDEIKTNVYRKDESDKVIGTTDKVLEKLDKIAELQAQGRIARAENERLTHKYATRVSIKTEASSKEVPSPIDQQKIVSAALGLKAVDFASNKVSSEFFQAVRKEITLTDSDKFTGNQKFLSEINLQIKDEFAKISEGWQVLEEHKLPVTKNAELTAKDQNTSKTAPNQAMDKKDKDKPLSLLIFEKELDKAERELIRQGLTNKLDANFEKNFDPKTVFSNDERASIKTNAIEMVKEKLEPKELNPDNRNFSPEASRQAFATYKQLERAAQIFQTGDDQSKITEAFHKLDGEATKLNQIRLDHHLNEKMALLRGGVKADLVDLLKKNQALKADDFKAEINKILLTNLNKADFVKLAEDGKQVSILSRQLAENIETKQISKTQEKALTNESGAMKVLKTNPFTHQNNGNQINQLDKLNDIPALTR